MRTEEVSPGSVSPSVLCKGQLKLSMAHFNPRVQVRELQAGSIGTTRGYPGAYGEVIRQYSASLAAASYEEASPPIDANAVDFSQHRAGATGGARRNNEEERRQPRRDVLVSNWYFKSDGTIYQGAEHTSPIVAAQGNVVTTRSGSRYVLQNRDPHIKEAMNHIFAAYQTSSIHPYRSTEPLHPTMIPFLIAAEMLVYGELKPYAHEVKARLIRLAKSTSTQVSDMCPVILVRNSYVP